MLAAAPVDEYSADRERSCWFDWGGGGPDLHFAHANGFPPGTYSRLVGQLLSSYHVVSMSARPLWTSPPPATLTDWQQLADDLRQELDERGLRGIPAVGHSLGAVISLLASADDPGLFSSIVAIDPLTLTGAKGRTWGVAKRLGQGGQLGLVKGALRRREVWPDRTTARRAYRLKGAFRAWEDGVFDDYIDSAFVVGPQGELSLRYPRHWEARIFEVSPHDLWPRLREVQVPVLFVRGEHSDAFVNAAAKRVQREMKNARVAVVEDTTHFVPMEKPQEVARLVKDFLTEVQGGVE